MSVIIGLLCLIVFNANGRAISAGDAFPTRYLPFAIWGHGTVMLDPIETLVSQGRERPVSWQAARPGSAFWMVPTRDGHLISLYSIVGPVLVSPLYLPAVAYVHWRGWTDERIDRVARIMEKLTASLVAALSAALLYLVLRRRAPMSTAVLLTIAYAFGTTTWVISSQGLWQHGPAQLLIVGLMLLLTAPCTVPRALIAGVLCGLIAGNRPADAVLAAALGLFGLFWAGRRAPWFIVAAVAPVGLVTLYNVGVVGAMGGAYARVGRLAFFQNDMRQGLAGLLFSPTRGLFVFSPFFLFLALIWRFWPRERAARGLTIAMAGGVIVQVLLYALTDWRGGLSWGPRFLTDLLPLLIWMLAPIIVALRGAGRVLFVTTVAVAIAIEAIGAFTYTGASDLPIYAVPNGPDKLRAAWDWRNAPFVASPARGRAPAELLVAMRGNIDRLSVDGRTTDTVLEGQPLIVEGWALAGRNTPLQVAITVDGTETFATNVFTDRPDIRAALPEAGAAGWRIAVDTKGLAPGEHRLSLNIWGRVNGDAYFLMRRTMTVGMASAEETAAAAAAVDLAASATIAAEKIRAHQQPEGYWLTAFTQDTRYERPQAEMNTYLTSLLVDLLTPLDNAPAGVADGSAPALRDSLARARTHLTAQIEPNGLVRYHGLPDAPGIGTLGCVITPDTDDTALVWRIAPDPDRRRLPGALATLERYRTADGLYRTWLATRADYQCLDPGQDPNPADLTIQMHLLQLLLQARPEAGRALCEALQPRVDQDPVWVYYRLSPLVPMLRATELRAAGCALELPASRTRGATPGQEIWIAVVRLLTQARAADAAAAEIDALLRQLAAQDFALVRRNPPLLYHNDLTATVPRYYWSEDAGYALWLRLARRAASGGGTPADRD